jgi:hypothetical protein
MAQQIVCDGCEQEPAEVLITSVANGEIKGVGVNCLPMWAEAIRDALAPVIELDDEQAVSTADANGARAETDFTRTIEDTPALEDYNPLPPTRYPDPNAAQPTSEPAEPELPADHPHAPAETGPGTYSDPAAPDPNALPADHPHAPAETGPGTYEEEGAPVPSPPAEQPDQPGGSDPAPVGSYAYLREYQMMPAGRW